MREIAVNSRRQTGTAATPGLFTPDRPIVFAFPGHPWLIHSRADRRTTDKNPPVRGSREENTTKTPFDKVVPIPMDRFHLVENC